MAEDNAETLPREIQFEILCRLPVKSVVRFRTVSKQWNSLISGSRFIKAHLAIHSRKEETKLIHDSNGSLRTITVTRNGNDVISRELGFQPLQDNSTTVTGSCNGLVLLMSDEKIMLINPTTLESHRIPTSPLALPISDSFIMGGIGYDKITDDYKVVTLSYYDWGETWEYNEEAFVDVYSVKNDLWTRVESSGYVYPRAASSGVLVDGKLHWLARRYSSIWSDPKDPLVIVAFDLSDEKLLEVPVPDKLEYFYHKLVVLEGCLCMFAIERTHITEVWMMEDYGIKESWTKFRVRGPDSYDGAAPLCLLGKDDLLLNFDGELAFCNMKEAPYTTATMAEKTYRTIDGIPTVSGHAVTFMESLVPPTFGNGT